MSKKSSVRCGDFLVLGLIFLEKCVKLSTKKQCARFFYDSRSSEARVKTSSNLRR